MKRIYAFIAAFYCLLPAVSAETPNKPRYGFAKIIVEGGKKDLSIVYTDIVVLPNELPIARHELDRTLLRDSTGKTQPMTDFPSHMTRYTYLWEAAKLIDSNRDKLPEFSAYGRIKTYIIPDRADFCAEYEETDLESVKKCRAYQIEKDTRYFRVDELSGVWFGTAVPGPVLRDAPPSDKAQPILPVAAKEIGKSESSGGGNSANIVLKRQPPTDLTPEQLASRKEKDARDSAARTAAEEAKMKAIYNKLKADSIAYNAKLKVACEAPNMRGTCECVKFQPVKGGTCTK